MRAPILTSEERAKRRARREKLPRFLAMRDGGDPASRRRASRLAGELVGEYGGLVGHVLREQAEKIPRALEGVVGREDLRAAGDRGLWEALMKHDPGRGSSFETYAVPMIRWAMIHEVRNLDMLTRHARDKAKRSRRAADELARRLGREATEEEAAAEAGVSKEDYREHRAWEGRAVVAAITEPVERYLASAEGDPLEHLCAVEVALEALEGCGDAPEVFEAAREIAAAVEGVRDYFTFGGGTVRRDREGGLMAATAAPRTAGRTPRQSQASPGERPSGGTYLYPHPLTLARSRAEAARIRLADADAYSAMCATWGSLGGLTTYYRYGADYFRLLARRRWAKVTAEELAG